MYKKLALFIFVLLCTLTVYKVSAQEETPTPEGEVTEVPTVVVVPDVVDVAVLQQRVDSLTTTVNVMTGIIVVLILTLGLAIVLLGRSAPPGAIKDILGFVGKNVIEAGSGELITSIEREVALTESELDDMAASVARHIYDKIYKNNEQAAPAPNPPPDTEAKG